MASREQGKYVEFHWALMELNGRADETSVIRTAQKIGLNISQLRRDMESPSIDQHIDNSMRLASELGFSGTPSFVIGDALAPGLIDADQMIALVNQASEVN